MAKVTNPLMGTSATGSVQALTWQPSRYGPILRTKPIPTRRVRRVQPRNRNILAYLSRFWGMELSETDRILWRQYANDHPRVNSLGQSYRMTGAQAFMSLNNTIVRRYSVNEIIEKPPVTALVATMATLVASDGAADGKIKLDWTLDGVGDAGDFAEIQISNFSWSPGQSAEIQNYSTLALVAGNIVTYTTDAQHILAWYWLRVRYLDSTGQVSPWLYVQWQAPDVA